MPALPPNNGVSDTRDEARAAPVERYEEVKRKLMDRDASKLPKR